MFSKTGLPGICPCAKRRKGARTSPERVTAWTADGAEEENAWWAERRAPSNTGLCPVSLHLLLSCPLMGFRNRNGLAADSRPSRDSCPACSCHLLMWDPRAGQSSQGGALSRPWQHSNLSSWAPGSLPWFGIHWRPGPSPSVGVCVTTSLPAWSRSEGAC